DLFRVSVTASGQELGYADLLIVDKVTGQLKKTLGDQYILMSEDNGRKFLKIRFRIEEGAVQGITIDATALTAADFTIRYVGTFPASEAVTLDLSPGGYRISAAEGSIDFLITAAGDVAYEPALEGILEGAGTSLLTMNGAEVQMTGPQLTSTSGEYLVVHTGVFPTAAVSTLHVLPGTKRINAAEGSVHVAVAQEGTFTYDPALEGILEGAGTSLLTMNGAEVAIDATALSAANFTILNTGIFPTADQASIYVLPGNKRFRSSDIDFDFQVLASGLIDYDPSHDSRVDGRGTTLLSVH
ncbi:MAG: hypothetical protein HKO65_15915, partial [Gemmatimonadetes bacterium]|nr:hypothetical protein [Gemmatimonadota bacterium]